jgi:hypothetical protein
MNVVDKAGGTWSVRVPGKIVVPESDGKKLLGIEVCKRIDGGIILKCVLETLVVEIRNGLKFQGCIISVTYSTKRIKLLIN